MDHPPTTTSAEVPAQQATATLQPDGNRKQTTWLQSIIRASLSLTLCFAIIVALGYIRKLYQWNFTSETVSWSVDLEEHILPIVLYGGGLSTLIVFIGMMVSVGVSGLKQSLKDMTTNKDSSLSLHGFHFVLLYALINVLMAMFLAASTFYLLIAVKVDQLMDRLERKEQKDVKSDTNQS